MTTLHFFQILFSIGALVSWDFVISYGFRAKWYVHTYGRIQLAFKTVIALVLTFVVANSFVRDYPGRTAIAITLDCAFVVGLIVLDIFLHMQLRKDGKVNDKST